MSNKKRQKKRKPKIDDYYSNGVIEMIRSGERVLMRSLLSQEESEEVRDRAKQMQGGVQKRINDSIEEIVNKVCSLEPGELLMMACCLETIPSAEEDILMFKYPETPTRPTEYIQSIIAGNPPMHSGVITPEEFNKRGMEVLNEIETLHSMIQEFYLCWAYTLLDKEPDSELVDFALEAQLLYFVRGKRYQILQMEYLRGLLQIHENEFTKLFGIGAEELIRGIESLEYALSQGRLDGLNKLMALYDEFQQNPLISMEEHVEQTKDSFGEAYVDAFSVEHYNVAKVTKWPACFIKELSYEPGEATWYQEGEYPNWPVVYLPVQKKPFICFDGSCYCFDYYSLMDNIYRVIQKTVARLDSSYVNQWSKLQQEASESMVEKVFKKLLPGCKSYRNNHYPSGTSSRNYSENDLIIDYEGVLLIIEVKAGSFVYTDPLTDYATHIVSYKKLIEEADYQCNRTYEYFESCLGKVALFDEQKKVKVVFDKENVNDVFLLSVTMDNINDFAARAERLSFLDLHCGALSLSIDDLMTYREYFDSPTTFMHFLGQRRLASQHTKLALKDEFDHLGMYIKHNCYVMQLDSYPDSVRLEWNGYREDLDAYFMSLSHPGLDRKKPQQEMPEIIASIIRHLDVSNSQNRIRLADYLLCFSTEARRQFASQIEMLLREQPKKKGMSVANTGGLGNSLRYSCFVNQPGVPKLDDKEKEDHVLGQIIQNVETDRVLLDIYFDEGDLLTGIIFKEYHHGDIPQERFEELSQIGEKIASIRMEKHIVSHGSKIGRNDLCPCGSGKKYKKCHYLIETSY